ncbi:MAG: hypothetical protein Q9195_008656 [Heterodermia aff. obscurata]
MRSINLASLLYIIGAIGSPVLNLDGTIGKLSLRKAENLPNAYPVGSAFQQTGKRAESKAKRSEERRSTPYAYFYTPTTDDDGSNDDSKTKRSEEKSAPEYAY